MDTSCFFFQLFFSSFRSFAESLFRSFAHWFPHQTNLLLSFWRRIFIIYIKLHRDLDALRLCTSAIFMQPNRLRIKTKPVKWSAPAVCEQSKSLDQYKLRSTLPPFKAAINRQFILKYSLNYVAYRIVYLIWLNGKNKNAKTGSSIHKHKTTHLHKVDSLCWFLCVCSKQTKKQNKTHTSSEWYWTLFRFTLCKCECHYVLCI